MTSAVRTEGHLVAPSDSDRKNYQRLFRVTFLFFLTLALIGRLLPRARRQGATEEGENESLIEEARRMSSTILPFVFIR